MLVVLTYSNHFHNGFHFDDSHSVTRNPAIRDIRNIPRFFAEARTFGIEDKGWTYRPVVSASLAIDYWLGNGLHPQWFHASTLPWLLFAIALIFVLFEDCLDRVCHSPANFGIALFAAALYGVHPALAETVNCVIQRADLYAVIGLVAGLVLYARVHLPDAAYSISCRCRRRCVPGTPQPPAMLASGNGMQRSLRLNGRSGSHPTHLPRVKSWSRP